MSEDQVSKAKNEDKKQEEANLGDVVGAMGLLASAFSPPEQQGEIQQQFNQLGQMLGGKDLLAAKAYWWEKMSSSNGDEVLQKAFAFGKDNCAEFNVYLACALIEGKPRFGKVVKTTSGLARYYESETNSEIRLEDDSIDFYVFCINPEEFEVEWVEWNNTVGDLPSSFDFHGNDVNIGFTMASSLTVHPGFILTDIPGRSNKLVYLYGGKSQGTFNFEVLVLKPKMKKESPKSTSALDIMDELDDIEMELLELEEKHRDEISELKKRQDVERKELKEKRKLKRAQMKQQLAKNKSQKNENQNIECATQ